MKKAIWLFLKIERTNLPAIEFADSDTVRIGEWAIAIGAPLSKHKL
jgi:S1-C subfamily serine protease